MPTVPSLLALLLVAQTPEPPTSAEQASDPTAPYRAAAVERWETAIREFEALDQREKDPEDAVLFVGSSSIRMWESIAEDMEPYATIRRGYGGAKFSDLAVFAERLIHPHEYRALVLFVANDVTGSPDDLTTEEVERLVRHILSIVRNQKPDVPVLLVEITPTPSRFAAWPQIRQVNAMMRELALTEPHTYFIPTAEQYLDAEKQPRPELFIGDRLHQNRQGYELWAKLIKRRLDDVLED